MISISKIASSIIILTIGSSIAWSNSFSCYGEAEGILMSADLNDAEVFVDAQLANESTLIGQQHCVVAELMKRLGDSRAEDHYKKAIALDPQEPGWELWYANYLTQVRGSMVPLREQGKLHYLRAIEKLKLKYDGRLDSLSEVDTNLYSWIQRGYSKMYQEDGLPITPWSWPARYETLDASDYYLPELFLTYTGRYTRGLSEFDRPDFARSRASEAIWVRDAEWRDLLFDDDVKRIATHDNGSDIYNTMVRLRLRHPLLTFEAYAKKMDIDDGMVASSMLFNSDNPNHAVNGWSDFATIQVLNVGASAQRSFNLYPLIDVHWEVGVSSQLNSGFMEWYPDQQGAANQIDSKMKLSRFIGPDKLMLDLFYMNMNIQDYTYPTRVLYDGNTAGRTLIKPSITLERDRYMAAIKLDYAIYRPIRLPFMSKAHYTRGWHFYGGMMFDSEKWWGVDPKTHGALSMVDRTMRALDSLSNDSTTLTIRQMEEMQHMKTRIDTAESVIRDSLQLSYTSSIDSSRAKVQNTDLFIGTHIKGIGNFDLQLQYSYFYTKPYAHDPYLGIKKESLHYAQFFSHILYRIIDEDVVPGMPDYSFISPIFLQLSLPFSYDYAIVGPKGYEKTFDTVKAQVEMQAKFLINPLGAYFIVTGGGGYQYYHTLKTGFTLFSGSVNMGWKF
ncbi:MAG: hypothetical protein OCC49_12820 [Fibrobacterales bacterium]